MSREGRNLKATEMITFHCPNLNMNKCRANSSRKAKEMLKRRLWCWYRHYGVRHRTFKYHTRKHTYTHNTYTEVNMSKITLSNVTHAHICKSIYLSFKGLTGSEFHLSECLIDTGGPLAGDKAGRVWNWQLPWIETGSKVRWALSPFLHVPS